MAPRTRLLILTFAILGLAFAGGASYVHYRLLTEPNYISPCDINATFNCSELYLSRFGSVGGVSVALGGLVFFLGVTLVALLSGSDHEGPAASYVFVMSTIGLAVVLYLGWASYFVLKKFCLLCLGTYVAVIGVFIVSGAYSAMPISRLPRRFAGDMRDLMKRPLHLFAALAAVVLSISLVGCFPKESATGAATSSPAATASAGSASDQENFEKIWAQQPRVDLGIPSDGAKLLIVKFNDWQCPSCKASYYAYKSLLDKYMQTPGTIKYVTKDYPLNNRCNFNVAGANHPGACEAAAAVRLAAEQGKDKENAMIEWLFAHQESLNPQTVEAQVKSALGVSDFGKQYVRLLPAIKSDAADGGALKVMYTPTYYINGVKAQTPDGNWIVPQYLEYAIQYELKRAGGK